MTTYIENSKNSANARISGGNHQLLWFAGTIGTTVGVAVWAYKRRRVSYWERTKRTVSQVAESAGEIKPWVGIGAGTAALGSAALAYRLRRPQSSWQKAGKRAEEMFSQTGKQLRPWLGVISSIAVSAASATYNSKSRKRTAAAVTDEAAHTADRVARAASGIWRRLQTISAESGKLYSRTRKLIA